MIYHFLEFLGVSPFTVLHWMLAVAITLFIIDIFLQTEFLSWIALFCFASYFSSLFDTLTGIPIQWSIVIFFVFLGIAFAFNYVIWRKIVYPIVSKMFLKEEFKESIEMVSGKTGIFRIIDGNPFVDWNGELWSAESAIDINSFSEKEKVKILKQENGKFLITKI